LRGAQGFWAAATLGLVLAALALAVLLTRTFSRQKLAPIGAAAA
jgi:hypothetical protein